MLCTYLAAVPLSVKCVYFYILVMMAFILGDLSPGLQGIIGLLFSPAKSPRNL